MIELIRPWRCFSHTPFVKRILCRSVALHAGGLHCRAPRDGHSRI